MRGGIAFGRTLRRYIENTQAAAAVEVALTLPFFLIFIAVMIETAVFFFATSGVEQGMFDYSRRLTAMTKTEKLRTLRTGVNKDLRTYVNPYLIKSFNFEIGPATENVDFKKPLTKNRVKDFTADKSIPVYLRVVAKRRTFTRESLAFVWNAISPSQNTGLFAPIDILVVIPFPDEENG